MLWNVQAKIFNWLIMKSVYVAFPMLLQLWKRFSCEVTVRKLIYSISQRQHSHQTVPPTPSPPTHPTVYGIIVHTEINISNNTWGNKIHLFEHNIKAGGHTFLISRLRAAQNMWQIEVYRTVTSPFPLFSYTFDKLIPSWESNAYLVVHVTHYLYGAFIPDLEDEKSGQSSLYFV